MRSRSINSDPGEEEGLEPSPDNIFSGTLVNAHSENQEAPPAERKPTGEGSVPATAAPDGGVKEAERGQGGEKEEQEEEADRLFVHLRDNMEIIREFCKDMVQQIPIPEQCVIEGNVNAAYGFVSAWFSLRSAPELIFIGLCSRWIIKGGTQREAEGGSLCNLLNLNEITVRCGGWG